MSIWEVYFLQAVGNETTKVEAKLCRDVLRSKLDEKDAESIINDIGFKNHYFCPDSEYFTIGLNSSTNFTFNLVIKDGKEGVFQQDDFVFSKLKYKQVSSYFNPKKYRENGALQHMDFVQEIYVNDIFKMQSLHMPIYLDHIKFYGRRWWDTSTLLGFDWLFLDEFDTYYTESIKQDVRPLMKNEHGQTIYLEAIFYQS